MNDKGEPPEVMMSDYITKTSTKIEPIQSSPYVIIPDYSNKNTITSGISRTEEEIKKIWERLNKTVSLVHNCANCGAKLEIEENHPIFHCKYCGSTYIIGATQPNSRY